MTNKTTVERNKKLLWVQLVQWLKVDGSEHIRNDRFDWKSLTERTPHDLRAFYLFYTLPRTVHTFFFYSVSLSFFIHLFVCSVLRFSVALDDLFTLSHIRRVQHVIGVGFSAVGAHSFHFNNISLIDVLTRTRAIRIIGPSIECKSSSSSPNRWFFVNSNHRWVFTSIWWIPSLFIIHIQCIIRNKKDSFQSQWNPRIEC